MSNDEECMCTTYHPEYPQTVTNKKAVAENAQNKLHKFFQHLFHPQIFTVCVIQSLPTTLYISMVIH
jgi:hypothetical protein